MENLWFYCEILRNTSLQKSFECFHVFLNTFIWLYHLFTSLRYITNSFLFLFWKGEPIPFVPEVKVSMKELNDLKAFIPTQSAILKKYGAIKVNFQISFLFLYIFPSFLTISCALFN